MNVKIISILLFFISGGVNGQHYTPSDEGSKVHFVIKNFGISTGGDFTGLQGDITFDPDNISSSKFEVSVAASTIDTDNPSRDNSLKEETYFDVQKYPDVKLISTKIDKTNKTPAGFYYFTGNVVIRGVTKPISFPFQAKKINDDYLFTGDFEIERLDFGVGEKSAVLANKVMVNLSVLAKKS